MDGKAETRMERKSERELVTTRTFNAPARLVFEAWSKPELFRQWWVPKSACAEILSIEMDMRVGGGYRLEMKHPAAPQTMAFFGKYLEVIPNRRIVWTNEESGDQGAITTVTLEEEDGQTLLTMSELYPTKEALDFAFEGMEGGMPESFEQLEAFLAARV